MPPPARCSPGLGPNKNLETVADSWPVAAHPSPARPLQASEPGLVSPSGALSTEPGRGVRGETGGQRPRGGWPPPPCWRAGTHRREAAPVLADDGAEAQEAGHHDEGTRKDEDVGRGGEGAGGQDTEVAALLHQGPDAHSHDRGAPHLRDMESERPLRKGPFSPIHSLGPWRGPGEGSGCPFCRWGNRGLSMVEGSSRDRARIRVRPPSPLLPTTMPENLCHESGTLQSWGPLLPFCRLCPQRGAFTSPLLIALGGPHDWASSLRSTNGGQAPRRRGAA